MITIKGIWGKHLNHFITESGEELVLYPKQHIRRLYYDLLPLECYALIDGDVIVNVLYCANNIP